MTKVEYIRASHREANRKLRSWLAFLVTLFRNVRFTLHFMECEIGELPPDQAREYLLGKQREYTRRLSYGSVPVKEKKRIDKTFEYLFARYPAHDFAEERHEQVMGSVAEVKTKVGSIAAYTDRKTKEDAEREQKEAAAFAAADKRRERHQSKSGFEPHPVDFSPKLSNTQFSLLTKHMNEIGVFQRDVTTNEVVKLFLCEHTEPLRTTHNKVIALLLERLSSEGLITPKWQQVAEHHRCFTSKMGKPLTAKDLSSAKQTAELIPEKKYKMILDSIDEVKRAR